jgi:hypothetical protein
MPYPTGLRNVGAKSEAIIGVEGDNRPSYSERFRETPCADPPVRRIGAGCCEGWGLDTPGYPISRAQVYALSSQVNVMLFTEQS